MSLQSSPLSRFPPLVLWISFFLGATALKQTTYYLPGSYKITILDRE